MSKRYRSVLYAYLPCCFFNKNQRIFINQKINKHVMLLKYYSHPNNKLLLTKNNRGIGGGGGGGDRLSPLFNENCVVFLSKIERKNKFTPVVQNLSVSGLYIYIDEILHLSSYFIFVKFRTSHVLFFLVVSVSSTFVYADHASYYVTCFIN